MRKLLLLVFAFALSAATELLGQAITTASISGKVSGAKSGETSTEALPGATVIAVHTPSGTKYGTATRVDGSFNFPAVRIGGPYTVTVTFVGYDEKSMTIDNLDIDQRFTANFTLGESSLTLSEIQVTAEKDPVLNSERTGAATSVRREQFERLPTLNRNFQDMASLDPRAGAGGNYQNFGGRSYLYNNFTIDGATTNNVFGLSNLSGGQTGAQPISMDAIQAMTISIAPYDVRQGAFTGAGVNAVTRSGTNEFSGSVYGFYKNQNMVGTKVAGVEQANNSFEYQNYGFRLGGPIIKDKLFFFVNYEQEKRVDPAIFFPVNGTTNGVANQPTAVTDPSDPNYTSPTNVARLRDFLISKFGYDPGSYDNFNLPTQSNKVLAKIDWNINTNHKLTVRYNQSDSYQDKVLSGSTFYNSAVPGGRTNSVNTIPFSHSFYRQFNNLKSIIAELNSSFGTKYSNTLTFGYSAFRDYREQGGGGAVPAFPTVDILGPNGQGMVTVGPDPFTPNNKLDQDIIQFNDNFNIYLRNHTISVGTANEFFKFNNVFTAGINGNFQFNSIQDFIDYSNGVNTATTAPLKFGVSYSAVPGNPAPGAVWSASQLGFYAQDEFTGLKNLKLTYGVRIDLPVFPTSLPQNENSDALTFANGEKVTVGKLPDTNPLWSPRVGFNWDVLGDKTLQVRGGTGLFTGRVPFVWISNQVTNNGLLFGSIIAQTKAEASAYPFTGTPVTSSGGASPTYSINATVNNFKFPQVFRTNIAVDKQLPWGVIGTLEAIYTKDVNAIYVRDANLNNAFRTVDGDGRPQFPATLAPNPTDPTLPGRRVNQNITNALILDNSNQGWQTTLVAQLQKSFQSGFYASVAYSYTDARDVNTASASTASSVFASYPILSGPNTPGLGYSANYTPHRVIMQASYRKEYAKHFATTISAIYNGNSGNKFSYTYATDMNGDGSVNDLMYIPRNQTEIMLTPSSATDTRSVNQIWQQLDAYINQDAYLSKHRGEYAARNGATSPWVNMLNMRVLQDFYIETGANKKRNTLQLSFEVQNVLNLLNSDWGLIKSAIRPALLSLAGFEKPAVTSANTETDPLKPNNSYTISPASGRPIYTFNPQPTATDINAPLSTTFQNNPALASRWQMQIGIRYIFN